MRILITGASGYVGGALARELANSGEHELLALSRDPTRLAGLRGVRAVRADALTGEGLDAALDAVDVAYYLIHAMEPVDGSRSTFAQRDRRPLNTLPPPPRAAVPRIVYLGGLAPVGRRPSVHLASRIEVERVLLAAAPDALALRASILVGSGSRSFRALVRLIERLPALPLPSWRRFRTAPIDGRDATAYLAAAADLTIPGERRAFDIAGPEVVSYEQMIERIADCMLVARPTVRLPFDVPAVTHALAARVSGEHPELIAPLMASLDGDLLADDRDAQARFGVRLHPLDRAIENALRDWEAPSPSAGAEPDDADHLLSRDRCAPEAVWAIAMDPGRLCEWVTIHRDVRDYDPGPPRQGSRMRQTLHLRGADVTVRWQLTDCDAPRRAYWEGRGPAWSRAHIEYVLSRHGDGGTRFEYSNDFHGPLGVVGEIAGRALVGGAAEREAARSLARLKGLAERA